MRFFTALLCVVDSASTTYLGWNVSVDSLIGLNDRTTYPIMEYFLNVTEVFLDLFVCRVHYSVMLL